MTIKGNIVTKTLDDFSSIGSQNSLQFQNSSYFKVINGEVLEDFNIFRDRYYKALMSYTRDYEFTTENFNRYKYRPKFLSAELYDTVDFWYILLIINNMYSCMDFNRKKIKVLTYEGVTFIKNVMMKEEKDIAENKKQVQVDMNEYDLMTK